MARTQTLIRSLLAALGVALAIAGQWALLQARQPGSPLTWPLGAALLALGALLFALTATDIPLGEQRKRKGQKPSAPSAFPLTIRLPHLPSSWALAADLLAVFLITAVAAAARFYRIAETPAGLWLDETDIAKQALEIVNGLRPRPWQVARLEVPWLYHYYVALFYKLLGPGYLTVKLPHLISSTLTAPVLYLLARQFLDRPIAFLSALLWATMRWSVNMSRWGHANTLTLFWICTVFFLLWRAQATGKWRWWILGGLALGLSQYAYQSTRALVAIVAVFLAYRALCPPRYFRRVWPQILLFWLLFALVYAPLAWTYVQNPELFLERSRAISLFNPLFTRDPWATLKENIGKYAGVFHFRGDHNGRHNIPGQPMLDPITGVLAVLGLALTLRRPQRPHHALLLLWVLPFLAVGILTTEAPNTFRIYALTPAIALLAGLAMQGVRDWVLGIGYWPPQRGISISNIQYLISNTQYLLPAIFLAIATATAAYLNLTQYFNVQATHPAVVGMFNVGPTRVGQYIATLPDDTTIYLDREFWAFSPIEVINPGRPLTRLKAPDHVPPPPAQTGPVAYILGTYGRLLVPQLQSLYPDALVEAGLGPNGQPIFTGVRLSGETVARKGLRGTWWAGLEGDGEPAAAGVMPLDPLPIAPPATADLRGGLYLPGPGVYGLRMEGADRLRLTLAGRTVLEAPAQPVSLTLPGGLVSVHLELTVTAPAAPRLLWRPPDAGDWQPIPQQNWYPLDIPEGGLLALSFEGGGLRTPPVRITSDAWLYADNAGDLATAAMRWLGRLRIPEAGLYQFGLSSDDASRLWIDDQLIVDNWGLHGAGWMDRPAELTAGWHRLRIDYIDNGGSHWFEVRWTPPGQSPGRLPADLLSWGEDDLAQALRPPENPPPVLRVLNAAGEPVGSVSIAAARLGDPKFNQPIGDANFQSWPMKLQSTMYDHGIGVYGPGEMDFDLGGSHLRFQGLVGVDTDTYGDAHTQVQIIGDGQVLWDSGQIHPWDPPTPFDVDVSGVRRLTLKQIEEGHFEGRGDAVDWVNPILRKPET